MKRENLTPCKIIEQAIEIFALFYEKFNVFVATIYTVALNLSHFNLMV